MGCLVQQRSSDEAVKTSSGKLKLSSGMEMTWWSLFSLINRHQLSGDDIQRKTEILIDSCHS